MKITVSIYPAANGEFAFRIKTANGRITLTPGETYKRRMGVRKAVESLMIQARVEPGLKSHNDPLGLFHQYSPLATACQVELVREALAWAKRKN